MKIFHFAHSPTCNPSPVESSSKIVIVGGNSMAAQWFLEKEMATRPRILAWRTPWTEEPGRLQSMGLQSVRHD